MQRLLRALLGTLMFGAVTLIAARNASAPVQAGDLRYNDEKDRIRIRFQIAPVPLNLEGKARDLVGLGSYWVKGINDCNFCPPPAGHQTSISPMAEILTLVSRREPIQPLTWRAARTSVRPSLPY